MKEIQEATVIFFAPITISYLVACSAILVANWLLPSLWKSEQPPNPAHPYHTAILAMMAAVLVLAIGNFLRIDNWIILPSEPWRGLLWVLTNLEIFSPIFLTLYFARQSASTIYISKSNLLMKCGVGLVLGVVCCLIFLSLRSELVRFPEVALSAIKWKSIVNFPAVFFEGMAVAFLFVRLQWAFGTKLSILIPSLLFAASHVPGSMASGMATQEIIYFLFLNTGICAFVLFSCSKVRDVIAVGIVHYLLDVAIKSF